MKEAIDTKRIQFGSRYSITFVGTRRVIVGLPDSFATKVSCDVFTYLSMEYLRTYFICKEDGTSFLALPCKRFGLSVTVRADTAEADVCIVDFFPGDNICHDPLIGMGEDARIFLYNRDVVGKTEPSLFAQDEKNARDMAGNAFRKLKDAFREKAGVDLHEFQFNFGRQAEDCGDGKLFLVGAVTSKECKVLTAESGEYLTCHNLSMLTEMLFS